MKKNKQIWLLVIFLMLGVPFIQAQENHQGKKQLPREVPSPEKIAKKMTDQMNRELQLTDKQYNKLYKLNLKEQKKRFTAKENGGYGAPPPMDREHKMPERRPDSDFEMGEDRPPMGDGHMRPDNNTKENSIEKEMKQAAAKEKKIKKILTAEQYTKWQSIRQSQESFHKHPQGDKFSGKETKLKEDIK